MPITFAEAKARINPDPSWFPKVGSEDYLEIINIMKLSGWQSVGDSVKEAKGAPPPVPVIIKPQTISDMSNPLNVPKMPLKDDKIISKHEWMAIKSNRDKFNEIINKNKNIPMK